MSEQLAILKYPLTGHLCEVSVPAAGIVRHVDQQMSQLMLWIEADPTAASERWTIETFATGQRDISAEHQYLGTVLLFEGSLVWHVYRRHDSAAWQFSGFIS